MERTTSTTSASEVTTAVSALTLLRANNTTGAVEYLEMNLDGGLIILGAFVGDASEPPNNALASALKSIEMARNYRAKYLRTNSSPEIAKQVAKTFDELEKCSQP